MPFKHNKKRNTGLVYEFLIRRMTAEYLHEKKNDFKKTFSFLKEHFNEGSILYTERELFETLRSCRGCSEPVARRILAEVKNRSSHLDREKLEQSKTRLIHGINKTFGRDFFGEHRIPEYRLLATIQMILDSTRSQRALSEDVQRIQLEENLIKFMTSNIPESQVFVDGQVDSLVYQIAEKKFNEKYGTLLPSQKILLNSFVRSSFTNDTKEVKKILIDEHVRITKILNKGSLSPDVTSDKPTIEKYKEASDAFARLDMKTEKVERLVEEVMLYQALAEEIEK